MSVTGSEDDSFTSLQKLKQEDNHKKFCEMLPVWSYYSQEYEALKLLTPNYHLFLQLYHSFGWGYKQNFHHTALFYSHSILPSWLCWNKTAFTTSTIFQVSIRLQIKII